MGNIIRISPIAVKDKHDVVKALTILERVGINRMSEEQKNNYLLDDTKVVDNNFMIQEEDGGFRIQSHYIGNGVSIESLEEQVNNINPALIDAINNYTSLQKEMYKKIEEINKKQSELGDQLKELVNSSTSDSHIIDIKEND